MENVLNLLSSIPAEFEPVKYGALFSVGEIAIKKGLPAAWKMAKDILSHRGILDDEIRPLPPEIAYPALQSSALCTNEDIRELWARLLANAADPNFQEKIRPAFVEILKGLSPDDAVMLQQFAADENFRPDYTDEQQRISRDNLMRLAVIDNGGGFDGGGDRLSALGAAFLRALK